jgi:hypothetical protein
MKHPIFFSWQSDTSTMTGRNLIERALDRAVGTIGLDTEVEAAFREGLEVDRDTKGVSGSPPIVDTIFKKIDAATVFVADMTFAGRRPDGAPIPNPNVLIEYGWDLKSLGHARIVSVMNTAFGNPTDEQMPFDMRHLRHPIQYDCPADADEGARAKARTNLAKQLEGAIRAVIDSDGFKASLPMPPEQPAFPAKETTYRPGRFRSKGQPLGVSHNMSPGSQAYDVHLVDEPALWLRVMPRFDSEKRWSSAELQKFATSAGSHLMPMNDATVSYGYIRAEDGFGVRAMLADQKDRTFWAVFAFNTGEVWTVDSYLVAATRDQTSPSIPLDEASFARPLENYSAFLERLGLEPPYRWIAGIDGIKGRGLHIPAPQGRISPPFPRGSCVVDCVSESGLHTLGDAGKQSLKPFFDAIYDKCGLERPAWLNEKTVAS